MNTPRPLALLTLSTLMLVGASAARADAADELDRAFEKLHQTSYRKREVWLGAAAAAGTKPAITEYRGDRSRMIMETDVPGYGTVRQERIVVGQRSAVRTVAPGITGRLNQVRRNADAQAARAVIGQVAGAGIAVATGGLGAKNVLHTVAAGMGMVSTAAQAHVAIGRANASFGTWQLVTEDTSDMAGFEAPPAGSTRVEKDYSEDPRQIRYRRVAAGDQDESTATIVIVSAATGVPIAEETIVNGQPMSRIEYFDVGAPIAIELPDVLR